MRIVLICLIFGSVQNSFAFSEGLGMPRALGLTKSGLWSAGVNPAALANMPGLSLGVASAKPYLLQDVASNSFAVASPCKNLAALGLLVSSTGTANFRTSSISLVMAKSFAQKVRFGLSLNYMQTTLGADYGRSNTLAVDLGLQVNLQRTMTLGFQLSNPTGARRSAIHSERYPTHVSIGLGYHFSEKLSIVAACNKSLSRPARLEAGCIYEPTKHLRLNAGVEGGQGQVYFGMGWKFKQWQLDLLSRMHPQLGQSPMFSLTYSHVRKAPVPICVD